MELFKTLEPTSPRLDVLRPAHSVVLPLAAAPFLLLPYDSLTHLLGADPNTTSEVLPATALFSVVYLVARGFVIRSTSRTRRVFLYLSLTFGAVVLVTLGNIVYEHLTVVMDADLKYRNAAGIRQGISLALGLTTFAMFQDAILRLGFAQAMRWALRGAIPAVMLAIVQVLMRTSRVQGFSAEPADFADFLVYVALPACAFASASRTTRIGTGLPGTLALLGTFSTTGILKGGFAILAYFASEGQLFKGLLAIPILVAAMFALFVLFPDNYAVRMIMFIWYTYTTNGDIVTASVIDRFFGFVGPLSLLGELHSWLGYGLAGDTVYFGRLFSPEIAEIIRFAKGDVASISSLQGKMLMYGGVWGYAIYLAAWVCAWRGTEKGEVARFMLPAVFVGTMFSLGPLFLPYTWLWLAAGAAYSMDKLAPPVENLLESLRSQ